LFERFPCDRVYALHNWPALPAGTIATRAGAIMGAADKFFITLRGRGAMRRFRMTPMTRFWPQHRWCSN
jgi:metal-dependent amidase/aminoacylase/carboxypeptidase family protein